MISSLDDLQNFYKTIILQKQLVGWPQLKSPGISTAKRQRLQQLFPLLTTEFLDTHSRFDLSAIAIGYIVPWPYTASPDLPEALARANGAIDPFQEVASQEGLLKVASIEGDPVYVALDGSRRGKGSIWWYAFEDSRPAFHKCADSFNEFLIVAANLWQLSLEERRDFDEFKRRVQLISNDENKVKTWQSISEFCM